MTVASISELTPKQERFVQEYLIDHNGTRAYLASGFKASSENSAAVQANRLLRNVKIRTILNSNQQATAKKLEICREDILKELLQTVKGAREDRDHGNVIRACSEINRMLGFNEPVKAKLEISGNIAVRYKEYQQMSDAQLLQLAGQERDPIDAAFERLDEVQQ